MEHSKLEIEDMIFNSTEFMFIYSEQYKNEIPLMAKNSYLNNPEKSIFNKKEVYKFKKLSKKLNKCNQGDEATFILKFES